MVGKESPFFISKRTAWKSGSNGREEEQHNSVAGMPGGLEYGNRRRAGNPEVDRPRYHRVRQPSRSSPCSSSPRKTLP